MEIVRVEPTPSPNTMKVVLDEKRQDNQSNTYNKPQDNQPQFINDLLSIDGVKSIFHVMDFLAIDKQPKYDWEDVLPIITSTLNDESESAKDEPVPDEHFGEVKVEILKFKGIPYQIKLTDAEHEERQQLPEKFVDSMLSAQKEQDNVVFLRKWDDWGVRYGEMDEIMNSIVEEIHAIYPDQTLKELVDKALSTDIVMPEDKYVHVTLEEYRAAEDWKARLRMLKSFPTPTEDDIPLLSEALGESKVPLRREAIVLIGMIEDESILPYMYKGLNDPSPAVRRTAGDCISDLGFKDALPEMEKALDDPQKIVRWRAAMFMFDEAGPEQLETLKAHADDSAYEVKLQIEMAISRIENGDEALGSVWKQIANRNK
ncbi:MULTISPECIES: conserved virulence factor C family protein [Staphylococcus]|uniref:Conserved virulence factor C n=1 Tax=Staphylococcus hsinchuensis TaxID=3051183 RepID=A0ABZ3EBA3_9STAP|nr:virulence factor [Staphylococcus sp. Marseille-Q5304]